MKKKKKWSPILSTTNSNFQYHWNLDFDSIEHQVSRWLWQQLAKLWIWIVLCTSKKMVTVPFNNQFSSSTCAYHQRTPTNSYIYTFTNMQYFIHVDCHTSEFIVFIRVNFHVNVHTCGFSNIRIYHVHTCEFPCEFSYMWCFKHKNL